ncbi:MAG: bifunctional serine/threonine-protein kinase/formylglycine-generating enzyme family protein [Planctomycetota bacterium]
MTHNGQGADPVQVLELVQEALALDGVERIAFLARLGEDSEELRDEVEDLLRRDGSGSDGMIVECIAAATRAEALGVPKLPPKSNTKNRYASRGEIARGGMGRIECTHDRTLARDVARKVALSSRTGGEAGSTALRRFLAEARVTGQLEHPGVVPVHDLGVGSDGEVYFTMRLVRGRDLAEILGEVHGPGAAWTTTRALGVLQRVCETMAFAHDQGVVHRDLKPANVMVGRYGEVYVMDWGLARVCGHEDVNTERLDAETDEPPSSSCTIDGTVLGTPYYMPPEQAAGEIGRVEERSDVYSVGAMLYHVLAGQPPYAAGGRRRPAREVVATVCASAPRPLSRTAPEVAPELVSICEKAMAREPGRRFASMTELAEELRAYLETRVVRSHRTGALAELHKWVQRNRGLASSVAVTLLAIVVGLAAVTREKAAGQRATEKAERIARLTAARNLERLEEQANHLWPPHPALIPELSKWIAEADELLATLDQPSSAMVPSHREQLAELRKHGQAVPRPAGLGPHALEPLLAQRRRELAARESAYGTAHGAAFEPPRPLPDDDPRSTASLESEAFALSGPKRVVFGREREGLALARLAVARLDSDEEAPLTLHASVWDTFAWAALSVGLVDEALAAGEEALALAIDVRKSFYRDQLALQQEAAESLTGDGPTERMVELEREVDRLQAEIQRPGWRFEEAEIQGWHDLLVELIADLERIGAQLANQDAGPTAASGWSVPARLAFAQRLEAESESAEAHARWREAAEAVSSSPLYDGLRLVPQVGLLPLGEDFESGLWEFAHLQSGEPALRRPDGTLRFTEATGVVLVLIPGGSFHMGAQHAAHDDVGYDLDAYDNEGPVHRVTLEPFFLSKHELSQAQWLRATGANPSQRSPEGPNPRQLDPDLPLLHPVEMVSWQQCRELVHRMGLALPTEAQWEYAIRAGTTEPWWTAGTSQLLSNAERFRQHGRQPSCHRRVDVGVPNRFGLRNMAGNVAEWCRDTFVEGFYLWSPQHDPLCSVPGLEHRVVRGASFSAQASRRSRPSKQARSSARRGVEESITGVNVGLRPARPLRLESN